MKSISVCIPTYEMQGLGSQFLKHSFEVLLKQTYTDFDVVISDHSQDDAVKKTCEEYMGRLDIHYYKNTNNIGSSSANINNCIKHAGGKLIKILFQDDFLFHERSLEDIVDHFDIQKDQWLMTACTHTRDGIHFFKSFCPTPNTIRSIWIKTVYSSPSTLTIVNDEPLFFDESLLWFMDSDYYRRYYDKFGEPKILKPINVVNRLGSHQVSTSMATLSLQKNEFFRMLQKHEQGLHFWYYTVIGCIKYSLKAALLWK